MLLSTQFEELEGDQKIKTTLLSRQMSGPEYEAMVEFGESAAIAGGTFCFFEIVALFVLGKAVKSMWFLINTAQFLVFMEQW